MSTAKKSSFLAQHWFLIALVTVLPVGILGKDYLKWLNEFAVARTVLVCLVMGMMALPIPFELIRQSLFRPWPAVLASLVNMVFIPLAAWLVAGSLSPYLAGGLIVAAVIPCTLASAAVWTRRAGGDDTVAILVTLITNSTCVIITPIWLVLLLSRSVEIKLWPMVNELLVVVLMPIAIAQLLRLNRRVGDWSQRNKQGLAISCQIGILIMVASGAIQMGQHLQSGSANSPVTLVEILWTVALTIVIHVISMIVAWYLAAATGVARPQQIAAAISGSQKTLMIGLKMALDCGVSIIPMVAFHVGQLLLDTFIADYIRKGTEDQEKLPALKSKV